MHLFNHTTKIFLYMKFKTLLILIITPFVLNAKDYELKSPNGKIKITVNVDNKINYDITHENDEVIGSSPISMTLKGGKVLGENPKVISTKRNEASNLLNTPNYKRATVKDEYNELVISFKDNYALVFRAYDDGAAYKFRTSFKKPIIIEKEEAKFFFSKDYPTVYAYSNGQGENRDQFKTSFENQYNRTTITKHNTNKLQILPMMVELNNNKKLCITEADLEDYPGMFIVNDTQKPILEAVMAPLPSKTYQGGHNKLQRMVEERHDYIAETKGTRDFPWRVFGIAENEVDIANSDLVYKLASPSRIKDISWIKPGKVAWEWWNNWNIKNVDFVAGVNNETYKYYIDFASKNNIEYVILDEGFNVNLQADMMQIIPEINLPELVAYAKQRNVDLILWAGYWAFNRDMEGVTKHYSDMGIKGFKIDFLDHDDQDMLNFTYKAAEVCAKYNMLVDFHGVSKPTGIQRTYPNVLNYEGVYGLEQTKWDAPGGIDMPLNDVTIPFIRMFAGPLDYTQGAMRNAAKRNYCALYYEPMSQGTRVHQLALYMIFDSPLNMLCDSPTNYEKEQESTSFIASVPTVWDETVAVNGKIGEYITMARRKGNDWYIGSVTNWDPRVLSLDLSFLDPGKYKVIYFEDGINAGRNGADYKTGEEIIESGKTELKINMAPGGGFCAKIVKL